MLDPFSRAAIVALTALCVLAAIELAPSPARGFDWETQGHARGFAFTRSTAGIGTVMPIRRDPFAEPTTGNALASSSGNATEASLQAPAGGLPSNLVSDAIPGLPGAPPEPGAPPDPRASVPPAAARVTAIVTGPHPYAMVETGGNNEIKGLGDRVGGIAIVAIDIAGVRLQNGSRLSVDPGARP